MLHARLDYMRIQDPANKIPQDEPVFLLRGQDHTAASVVRYWAFTNMEASPDLAKLALAHADRMDAWTTKKTADIAETSSDDVKPEPEEFAPCNVCNDTGKLPVHCSCVA